MLLVVQRPAPGEDFVLLSSPKYRWVRWCARMERRRNTRMGAGSMAGGLAGTMECAM